ncbi:farnesyltranstransferase [Candidatus Rickettsiella viridis]|uniref:Octaprenyl diphosphate synthase n=2 Tax=Candidatus Rickettsiella viridis TaxID=676208 RepID=A0A2Z5UTL7_9COXI|nr:farnesyltranstransferase [Candidatus Rickettsiella viridis]
MTAPATPPSIRLSNLLANMSLMDLTPIQSLVAADFARVDSLIAQCLHSEIPLIPQLATHLIHSGGKRLRPLITLLSAGASGYQGDAHVQLAATLELIHTATLLHDDVIDASELRRGKKTANTLWGNSASILVGDFLYSRAFQLMVKVNNLRALQSLADATNTLSQSEIWQLINCHNPDLDETQYLKIVAGKTGILFSIAAEQPAILAERNEAEITAMLNYGLQLGIAFQLIDDTLDYVGSATRIGKAKGDDLAEGKTTLPLIYALQHADKNQTQLIHEAISQGKRKYLKDIIRIIKSTGAIDYTYQRAKEHAAKAIASLEVIPDSIYKQALATLAEFATTRTH